MSKRKLKRQLNLAQVVMLGTAGAIGAEIFVLTGYAAGLAGPATILALLAGGLLTYSIALNYCELATAFPVAGGAMTYVREAYGNNILSFLVGSMDCLSSTFYAALSAMGFAYSLQVFFPGLPVVFTAIAVIAVFTALNILGVTKVGNTQILLGVVLLLLFAVYIVLGFVRPAGFRWETFLAGGSFFVHPDAVTNLSKILRTIALIYVAYVGFEVIADDAEEVQNPSRTIPLAILLSLTLVLFINVLTVLVTLGVVPWPELASSPETALTQAVRRFLPGWGAPMMAVAGIIATLTTITTSMLSATREGFTLSRDGTWPRAVSRLGRFHTPYVSILAIGAISCLVAAVGLVDFLSYISSAGYLFVLFWASLAMIRLRQRYPDLKRPFKVPFFPLTAYVAAATGFIIVVFTEWRALLFGVGVLAACSVYYYARRPVGRILASRLKTAERAQNRILVPVANPRTAESLVHLASILAQASEDTSICVLTVAPTSLRVSQVATRQLVNHLEERRRALLDQIIQYAYTRNVPLYTKMRAAASISQGILEEAEKHGDVKLILMGWPGPLDTQTLPSNPANEVLMAAHTNFAVLLDRGLKRVRRILAPIGGGPHSRLAIRLAYEIAAQEGAQITALHLFSETASAEEIEDEMLRLREIIEDELGYIPVSIATRVAQAKSVPEGILAETTRQPYDLLVVGASEEWASRTRLFGSIDDWIADKVCCSVLLVRRYEPVTISWLRRQIKKVEKEHQRTNAYPPNQGK
jgi:amino acid transporter